MSQRSSTFIRETRERETWLGPTCERQGGDAADAERLAATAALARGALQAIPVPEDAEERSRAMAVAYMDELRVNRVRAAAVRAPWYLRMGRFLRFVFTLGRRR